MFLVQVALHCWNKEDEKNKKEEGIHLRFN